MKEWLKDFPNQNGTTVTGIVLILMFGVAATTRFAMGLKFPDGYDGWLFFLGTLAGVSMVGMIGKRATDISYAAAKNPSPVTVEAGANVTMEHPAAVKPATPLVAPVQPQPVPPAARDD